MTVLFVGLGVMGSPMAGHLLSSGQDVIAYNRTAQKALAWKEKNSNGRIASDLENEINAGIDIAAFDVSSLTESILEAEYIISCIGKDEDVEALGLGPNGVLEHAKEGTIWIDHTTTSASIAKKLFEKLRAKGISYLDAPVSGGEAGAINGSLTAMVGGTDDAFQLALPYLNSYCKNATLIGPSGSGQLTKMVNQICLAGVLQGLSEGLNFARLAGLDREKVINTISKGAAQSWQMDNRALTMIDDKFDFGFAIDLMRKDLNICFDEAKRCQAELTLTEEIDKRYQHIQEQGFGNLDTSALIKQFDIIA